MFFVKSQGETGESGNPGPPGEPGMGVSTGSLSTVLYVHQL